MKNTDAKVITFSIFKGGTGKTTSAVNNSVALAKKKQRVLLEDLDHQVSATRHLGIDPEPLSLTFMMCMSKRYSLPSL